jgi:hypothetical protein
MLLGIKVWLKMAYWLLNEIKFMTVIQIGVGHQQLVDFYSK